MPDATATTLQGRSVHDRWTAAYRTPANEPFYAAAFDWIGSQIPAGAHVLDAGCGAGTKTAHLLRRGYRVTAIDLSREMLADAQRTNPGATFQQADLTALPFPTGHFPAVLCWGVLMHVPSIEKALAELCRVTAPGGLLILSENNQDAPEARLLRAVRWLRGPQVDRYSVITLAGHVRHEDTPDGPMVTRLANPSWLIDTCHQHGFRLRARRAAELTQLYALHPSPLIHWINRAWFHHVRAAGPAFGNLFVFRKPARRLHQNGPTLTS